MLISQHAPNDITVRYDDAGTGWVLLASDGSSYASLALLKAAGKTPYPGLPPGGLLQFYSLVSEDGSGGNGDGFYYRLNGAAAPSDLSQARFSTGRVEEPGSFHLIWLKKITSGDVIVVSGGY